MQKNHPLFYLSRQADFSKGPVIHRKRRLYQGTNAVNFIFEYPTSNSYFSFSKKIRFLISYFLHHWIPKIHPKDPPPYIPQKQITST
jgi:hypothetical protein